VWWKVHAVLVLGHDTMPTLFLSPSQWGCPQIYWGRGLLSAQWWKMSKGFPYICLRRSQPVRLFRSVHLCMYWQTVRLFWGVGECFLFVSFDAPVWMYCGLWEASSLTFLRSLYKLDFDGCRRRLKSGFFVWCACLEMYSIFESCVIISIWIRQNSHSF